MLVLIYYFPSTPSYETVAVVVVDLFLVLIMVYLKKMWVYQHKQSPGLPHSSCIKFGSNIPQPGSRRDRLGHLDLTCVPPAASFV